MWEKVRINVIKNSYKNIAKLLFEKANEEKHGFQPRSSIVKDDEETIITDKEDATRKFKKVFEKC